MNLRAMDVEYTTRVETATEAWEFLLAHIDEGELLSMSMVAQEWRPEDEDEWIDTLKVTVCIRTKQGDERT